MIHRDRVFRALICAAAAACSVLVITGCSSSPARTTPPGPGGTTQTAATQPGSAPSPIRFESVAAQAGIDFKLGHNGKSPLTILETTGGGCAFFDFDSDGWPDILLAGPQNVKLYRNERNGKFRDVTPASGLDPAKYWMGCAVGDYDGDGRQDIFLTGYRCFALYHNEGNGRFKDVTKSSGVVGLDWSLSGVFSDLDGDGRLDLFVSQYLKFDDSEEQLCQVGSVKSACGPEMYAPLSGKLFRNLGGGKFQSVPWKDSGKTWGALASDLLGEGRPSLYLANDMVPGDLFSRRAGKWENVGPASGTAFDAQGHVQGGMGVDSADYDNDGRLDLIVTTYFAQPTALYHNDGQGLFTEVSSTTRLGPPSLPYVGFGAVFSDFDCDGWQDLVITNGHVRDNVKLVDSGQDYAQPMLAFRNENSRFIDVSTSSGLFAHKAVGRGLSVADYDRDGRQDVLVCDLEGSALLFRNVSENGHWLQVALSQPGGLRDGSGALLTLDASGKKQIREIRTCGSVLSGQMPLAHFGLGAHEGPVTLTVRWPGGKTQKVAIPKVDQIVTVGPSGVLPR